MDVSPLFWREKKIRRQPKKEKFFYAMRMNFLRSLKILEFSTYLKQMLQKGERTSFTKQFSDTLWHGQHGWCGKQQQSSG